MRFKGKVIFISGSASGFGKELAFSFAQEGALLFLTDIDAQKGIEVADTIKNKGVTVYFEKCDVGKSEEVKKIFEILKEKFGRLDIAINNAGISGSKDFLKTHQFDEVVFDQVLETNTKSVWLCMREQLPLMLKNGSGSIVNVSSVAGLQPLPGNVAYTASKHAVIGITKTAALEYAAKNIRVNAVCPAFHDTPMVQQTLMQNDDIFKKMMFLNPMRRLGKTSETTKVISFLCSDDASFINGQAIAIDGGLTIA